MIYQDKYSGCFIKCSNNRQKVNLSRNKAIIPTYDLQFGCNRKFYFSSVPNFPLSLKRAGKALSHAVV